MMKYLMISKKQEDIAEELDRLVAENFTPVHFHVENGIWTVLLASRDGNAEKPPKPLLPASATFRPQPGGFR